MFVEICMQIHSLVFALISRQINKKKVCENNLLCTGNKVCCKISSSGGRLTPHPLRTVLTTADLLIKEIYENREKCYIRRKISAQCNV